MGSVFIKLQNRAKNLANRLREYPLESALCITYFLIWVFRVSIGNALKGAGLNVNVEQFFVWFVPQFVLCYALHQFKDRNRMLAILYYLSWFVWIPLLLLCSSPNEWSIAISYLLAGLALLVGTEKMDNERFGHHIIEVTIKLAEGLKKADDNTPAKDVLIYENGRYKAVFWIITDKNGYPSSLITSMSVLFKRPEK